MNIAFYAPLKSPNSPTPSGDRQIARHLIRALKLASHTVELASELKSYEGEGDRKQQDFLRSEGGAEACRLTERIISGKQSRPDLWLTYHLYHKAPDWIGPEVSAALDIPYVVAEASISPKQANGKWQDGYRAAGRAISHADLILGLNPRDAECVGVHMKPCAQYETLAPFIDIAPFGKDRRERKQLRHKLNGRAKQKLNENRIWLTAVGMMRKGDKTESYRQLANALKRIEDLPWSLFIIGDGEESGNILPMFHEFQNPVIWLGEIPSSQLPENYGAMDILAWPSVNEALGMVFLEAGGSGLPVVAGHTDGVASIVHHNKTGLLSPPGDTAVFAQNLRTLICDETRRDEMGQAAAFHIGEYHSIEVASQRLDQLLKQVATEFPS
ncbi:MAG: glycosyltransferase family 4 protein [Hyphomicrobiaceae bacterium]